MKQISLSNLIVSKLNMRYGCAENECDNECDISTLADSIRSQGILNPILVRPNSLLHGQQIYEVYAGRRRFMAAKSLNMDTIPCIVHDISDEETMICSLVENYQRRETSYSEKVKSFNDLYENIGESVSDKINRLCQLVGCTSKTVKRYLRLGSLSPNILSILDKKENHLTLKCAELLLNVKPEHRETLVEHALASKLSSVEFETLVLAFNNNADLPNLINEIIDKSSQNRKQKINLETKTKTNVVASENQNIVTDEDMAFASLNSEDDDKKDETATAIATEKQKDITPEEVSEKVNKKRPWLYDPNDKSKIPKQIEQIYLSAIWELYDKLTKS